MPCVCWYRWLVNFTLRWTCNLFVSLWLSQSVACLLSVFFAAVNCLSFKRYVYARFIDMSRACPCTKNHRWLRFCGSFANKRQTHNGFYSMCLCAILIESQMPNRRPTRTQYVLNNLSQWILHRFNSKITHCVYVPLPAKILIIHR